MLQLKAQHWVQLPQFLKKHFTWYSTESRAPFAEGIACSGSFFHVLKLERCWDTSGLQTQSLTWENGDRRAVRSGKRLHNWAPFCSPCDRSGCLDLPWALTNPWSPGTTPGPSQLALPRGLSGGFCTHRGNAEALMEQIADNFQHLDRKIGTLSLPPHCWKLPSKTRLSQPCLWSAPPPLAHAPLVWSLFYDQMPTEACDEENALTLAHLMSRSGAEHAPTQNWISLEYLKPGSGLHLTVISCHQSTKKMLFHEGKTPKYFSSFPHSSSETF